MKDQLRKTIQTDPVNITHMEKILDDMKYIVRASTNGNKLTELIDAHGEESMIAKIIDTENQVSTLRKDYRAGIKDRSSLSKLRENMGVVVYKSREQNLGMMDFDEFIVIPEDEEEEDEVKESEDKDEGIINTEKEEALESQDKVKEMLSAEASQEFKERSSNVMDYPEEPTEKHGDFFQKVQVEQHIKKEVVNDLRHHPLPTNPRVSKAETPQNEENSLSGRYQPVERTRNFSVNQESKIDRIDDESFSNKKYEMSPSKSGSNLNFNPEGMDSDKVSKARIPTSLDPFTFGKKSGTFGFLNYEKRALDDYDDLEEEEKIAEESYRMNAYHPSPREDSSEYPASNRMMEGLIKQREDLSSKIVKVKRQIANRNNLKKINRHQGNQGPSLEAKLQAKQASILASFQANAAFKDLIEKKRQVLVVNKIDIF